ncbi:gpW family head-tail joining protein [Sphingomonas sp. Leaf25]|uniref:gpW family head-tail joining protein n=1 Tax=Sphingomonas sp. Leaf25 TaxID=1735692 RepID=UPI0006FBA79A|nr:gpW family head-tail joining protein [Sphingomonas sp. Leaf25]KQN00560.1 phage head-tail adapter protein [Sphingomonas sp. Leaf25]
MSIFDGLTPEQLRAALTSAQLALIELQQGKAIASVSYTQGDGAKSLSRRVTTVAEVTMLIMQLQRALGIGGRRRAMGFRFR